ncbi:NAD(P)-binding protein [Rhizodiscina lignyota]|uniref:NAD(P)-binding protein n=1 Tax=Rhizodiscina lignyota TaxID=1504668 RepID=A0A9P4MBK7_9PEZI|nr:NAD(P)-binding protein [Rhizodiscina lignyota]
MTKFSYFPPSELGNGEVLAEGSLVLITGAPGLIGSHVVDQCLAAGLKVRGATRDRQRNAWLDEYFHNKYGSAMYETVEVKDMTVDGAYDEAVKDCAGVVHLATIGTFSTVADEVIPPAVEGALNVIRAAAKQPTIKRFVYTSSSAAALGPKVNEEITLTQESWNEEDAEFVHGPSPSGPFLPMRVYAASKVKTEQALWKFMEEEKPGFTLTSVLPEPSLGRILHQAQIDQANEGLRVLSANYPRIVYAGHLNAIKDFLPPRRFTPLSAAAAIHVAGLILPDTAGERIFACSETWNWNRMLGTLRTLYPTKVDQFGPDIEGLGHDLSKVPNDRAEDILKRVNKIIYGKAEGWASFEECVRDCLEGMPGVEVGDSNSEAADKDK